MRNKTYGILFLFIFILFSIFFGVALITNNDYDSHLTTVKDRNKESNDSPKLALGPPIAYYAIDRNATTIYRLYESINITLDTFSFPDTDHAFMEISFTNGTIRNYTMDASDIHEYSYEYKPKYNAPLGFQNVSFYLLNNTNTLLNAHTTYTNFTIKTNYMVITNSSGYYIGDVMYAELTVNDFGAYQFVWNLSIVNSTIESEQGIIKSFDYNSVQFTYRIKNQTVINYVGKRLYLNLNMTDKISGKKASAYFPFDILNTAPNIIESSLNFSESIIYRSQEYDIKINATDIEDIPSDLEITVIMADPLGGLLPDFDLKHQEGNEFSGSFTIPAARPIGRYQLNITAKDQNAGSTLFSTYFSVENNLPEIHSYKINGISMGQPISLLYGENLVFTFNVSDVEKVAYVKVALIDENNEWFNITRAYIGEDTKITIRTIDLITGVWYVYIYVVDSDGAIVSLIDDYNMAPQAITIVPDVLSEYLPWIVFIIGIIFGLLAGVAAVYKHFKSKYFTTQGPLSKKKEAPLKKSPKVKKEKIKPAIEPIEEKKEEEKVKTEEEVVPQRKIKRKL
ncbi:MAG: hypothetical protein ACFFCI_14135 [Promethearchaeota archaeon]